MNDKNQNLSSQGAELGQALGWGSDMSLPTGPVELAEGAATFEVKSLTKSRFEGSDKLAPSPMAVLDLEVLDADGTQGVVERRIILNSKLLWQISDLMRSVGLVGEDDASIPASCWDKLVGRKGVCVLETRESSRGTKYSSVERFLHGQEANQALAELGRSL